MRTTEVNSRVPSEDFQPPPHMPPSGIRGRLMLMARLALDFQFLTIHHLLSQRLPAATGTVVDLGCGNSPFRHLLNVDRTKYLGIDIEGASEFGYRNPEVLVFDGRTIPLEDGTVDVLICTEVLEHIDDPDRLIAEMHRVLRLGGSAIVTVPWSARVHFHPHDYYRYTQFALKRMFSEFDSVEIQARGTDINAIVAKLVVLFARSLRLGRSTLDRVLAPLRWLMAAILSPFLGVAVVASHVAWRLDLGSSDDPLGFSVIAGKAQASAR